MPNITKVKLNGLPYIIKDTEARERLDSLEETMEGEQSDRRSVDESLQTQIDMIVTRKDDQIVDIDNRVNKNTDAITDIVASKLLTESQKEAILECFRHVAWIDDQGAAYYSNLREAFYVGINSISVIYAQQNTVYDTNVLDDLRSYLTVIAHYSNGVNAEVYGYELSGDLNVGTNTITVTFNDKTATFSVDVVHVQGSLSYISAIYAQDPNTVITTRDSLEDLKQYLTVTANYDTGEEVAIGSYTLSGTLKAGQNTITVTYADKTTTFDVTAIVDTSIAILFEPADHDVYTTDSLESLRDYLTVTVTNNRTGAAEETDAYTLEGNLSNVGSNTVTVRLTGENVSGTFTVNTTENTTGILYDWDFTKSLKDSRQAVTTMLGTGEAFDIPGKSEGTTAPVRNSSGIVFNDAQQLARLIDINTDVTTFLRNKTIQIDFANYTPAVLCDYSQQIRSVRVLMTSWDRNGANPGRLFELGLLFGDYGWMGDDSTLSGFNGWMIDRVRTDGIVGSSYDDLAQKTAYPQNAISGKTVTVSIDNDNHWSVFIGQAFLGKSKRTLNNGSHVYGLQIGSGASTGYGGILYNATVTGVRIYEGAISSYITAVFTQPQTDVKLSDDLNTLKNNLVVTYYSKQGETGQVLSGSDYTLTGTLTAGISTITANYNGLTDTFNVTVVEVDDDLLYDWDFTKSLTDSVQGATALLATGEAFDIPGKSEGTTAPVRNSSGIVFNDAQQLARLIDINTDVTTFLRNKTIQIDFASYTPAVNVSNADNVPSMRVLMTSWDKGNAGTWTNELGLSYLDYTWASDNGVDYSCAGWGIERAKLDGSAAKSYDPLSSGYAQNAISGKTLSVYIDSNGYWNVYIGGASLGRSKANINQSYPIHGLQIGSGARTQYGGVFYNARVTGARIYNGQRV